MSDDNERVIVAPREARKMLPKGKLIHTFRCGPPGVLIGDWDRVDILSAIRKCKCELSGAMGHGLVIHTGNSPLFVATTTPTP